MYYLQLVCLKLGLINVCVAIQSSLILMTNILKRLYNKHNIGVGWGHVIGSLKMGFEIKFEITIFEI